MAISENFSGILLHNYALTHLSIHIYNAVMVISYTPVSLNTQNTFTEFSQATFPF